MKLRPRAGDWSLLILRLVVGYGFMAHGFAKLGRGPDAFAALLSSLNVPFPLFSAWLTIATEILGGLAIFLGAFVALASIPLSIVLLVAVLTVHLPYGFSSVRLLRISPSGAVFGPVGYELNLLYLAALLTLALAGSGPFSVDNVLRKAAATHT